MENDNPNENADQVVKESVVLLPCPFCGSKSLKTENTDKGRLDDEQFGFWRVACAGCSARGPDTRPKESAPLAWNQRSMFPADGDDTIQLKIGNRKPFVLSRTDAANISGALASALSDRTIGKHQIEV